jgi:hypothetical protein
MPQESRMVVGFIEAISDGSMDVTGTTRIAHNAAADGCTAEGLSAWATLPTDQNCERDWQRWTLDLWELGVEPYELKVNFMKGAEVQARGAPHH